jgi:lipopolysaccharide export system permease protein
MVRSRLLRPLTRRLAWQRLPLLDRWLLQELTAPLLFGIAAFTAVSLSVGVLFDLVRRIAESGLPAWAALQILVLKMPGFLVLSFPMATLMATLLAYSRLSSNSELTALRSVGVRSSRMVLPALALSLAMSVLTFIFNDIVVPQANLQAADTLERALGSAIAAERSNDTLYSNFADIQTKDGKSERRLTQLFYSRYYLKGLMVDITLLDFSHPGQRQMLTAKTGLWDPKTGMWNFWNGRLVNINETNGNTTTARFTNYQYSMGQGPIQVAQLPTDATMMTVGQAVRAERLLREANNVKEARRMRVRIQEKFALPAICLVFGLIGSSLGVRPNARTSRSQGFGISVILIFGYYLVSFIFSSLGVTGSLPAIMAAWSPVFIGLTIGAVLLRQASR